MQLFSNGLPYDSNYLNDAEKRLFMQNPTRGVTVLNLASNAIIIAETFYQEYCILNGNGDAFRHAYWNPLMTHKYDSDYAKLWGDAHESDTPRGNEYTMDIYNNLIGRNLCEKISSANNYWEARMQSKILSAVASGEMIRIVNNNLARTDGTGRK